MPRRGNMGSFRLPYRVPVAQATLRDALEVAADICSITERNGRPVRPNASKEEGITTEPESSANFGGQPPKGSFRPSWNCNGSFLS